MAQLISSLPVGSKIKFGKHQVNKEAPWEITWFILDRNHTGYPANSITLMTEEIIDMRAMDAKEPSNPLNAAKSYGYNRYMYSNMRQWLNSSAASWYNPQHSYDGKPDNTNVSDSTAYDTRNGFLVNFTTEEINAILNTTVKSGTNNADLTGTVDSFTDKVFLPSLYELGITWQYATDVGSTFSKFSNDASRIAKIAANCFSNTLCASKPFNIGAWSYWTRTCDTRDSSDFYAIKETGTYNSSGSYAYYGMIGIRPMCNITNKLKVSDTPDSDGAYTIIWNEPPVISPSSRSYGDKKAAFSIDYSVTDIAEDTFTITERLDNEVLTTHTAQTGTVVKSIDLSTKWQSLALGVHTITVTAQDQLGAVTVQTYTFNKTNSPPEITGIAQNLGPKDSNFNVSYVVNDSDATDTVAVTESLDGVVINVIPSVPKGTPNNISIDVMQLALGDHTITISATDTVGNITTVNAKFELTFKKMYPGAINSPITLTSSPIGLDTLDIPILRTDVLPVGPNLVVLGQGPDAETILYESVDVNTSSIKVIKRGFEGEAKQWPSGTAVARNFTNYDYITMVKNLEAMHTTMKNTNLSDIAAEFVRIKKGVIEIDNVSIPTTAWVMDSSSGMYKAIYNNNVITGDYVPYVNINTLACIKAANEASMSTFVESGAGTITMYSEEKPSIAITCNIQLIKEVV